MTLLRAALTKILITKKIFIYIAPLSLNIVIGHRVNIREQIFAVIKGGYRTFELRVSITDITDQCILRLVCLQEFNITVNIKNEITIMTKTLPYIH